MPFQGYVPQIGEQDTDKVIRSVRNLYENYTGDTWTPVLTFATAGDLSVTYTEQVGQYIKIGKLVIAFFGITTSAFTWTTASGNARITGLPYTADNSATIRYPGSLSWGGITKANYTHIIPRVDNNTAFAVLAASGSAQSITTVAAADMPSAGTVTLRGCAAFIASA